MGLVAPVVKRRVVHPSLRLASEGHDRARVEGSGVRAREHQIAKAREMRAAGATHKVIAATLGVSENTAWRWAPGERPLPPAAKAYLAAFDEWPSNPTERSRLDRADALAALLARPSVQARADEHEATARNADARA